jgi:hypothetical protein
MTCPKLLYLSPAVYSTHSHCLFTSVVMTSMPTGSGDLALGAYQRLGAHRPGDRQRASRSQSGTLVIRNSHLVWPRLESATSFRTWPTYVGQIRLHTYRPCDRGTSRLSHLTHFAYSLAYAYPSLQDPTPQDSLDEWLQSLHDPTNPNRRSAIDILCPVVLDSDSEPDRKCKNMAEKLLNNVCGHSKDKLSKMLQFPFLHGQTPIEWTIWNLPYTVLEPSELSAIPPVLLTLIVLCGDWKKSETLINSMHAACCDRDCNNLYQWLKKYPDGTRVLFDVNRYPFSDPSSLVYNFQVDEFPMMMLKDSPVEMRFIWQGEFSLSMPFQQSLTLALDLYATGLMFSVGFKVENNKWEVFCEILMSRSADNDPLLNLETNTLYIDLLSESGTHAFKLFFDATSWLKTRRLVAGMCCTILLSIKGPNRSTCPYLKGIFAQGELTHNILLHRFLAHLRLS